MIVGSSTMAQAMSMPMMMKSPSSLPQQAENLTTQSSQEKALMMKAMDLMQSIMSVMRGMLGHPGGADGGQMPNLDHFAQPPIRHGQAGAVNPNQSGPGQSGSSPMGGPAGAAGPFNPSAGELQERLPGPLKHLAPVFQDAGQRFGIDPKFLAAISMMETGKGTSKAFRSKNNAMGVSNSSGPIRFDNPAESIYKMAKSLANKQGPYKGADTIGEIGRIYAPPGAGNDPNQTNGEWPAGVAKFFQQLGGNPQAQVVQR